jgi:peptidoglycan hydrolase-like protein with peptidoglycan-binding domain
VPITALETIRQPSNLYVAHAPFRFFAAWRIFAAIAAIDGRQQPEETTMAILKRGMAGEPVRRLQEGLDIEDADGMFGPATEKALREYQKTQGLAVDGVAGPDTFAELELFELIELRNGTSGDCVERLQVALGLEDVDGKFGPGTEKAVKAWQSSHGMTSDGVVTPLMLSQMDIFKDMITPETLSNSRVSDASVDAWKSATEGSLPSAAPSPIAPAAAAAATASSDIKMATASMAGSHSIWSTIKSVFGK